MKFFAILRRWRSDDRWACLLAYGLLLIWCLPLFAKPGHFGAMDWDWFVGYFSIVRRTLLEYNQFPGYNPWMYLGSPLWETLKSGLSPHSFLSSSFLDR